MLPLKVREEIVARLTLAEKRFIDLTAPNLRVQFIEMRNVIFHSAGSVIACCAGLHQERTVARLREEEFARELSQGAIDLRRGVFRIGAGSVNHASRG